MHSNFFKTLVLFGLLFVVNSILAQDTIPSSVIQLDSAALETIIVREVQEKIEIKPRSVRMRNPLTSLKITESNGPPIRIRIPSFWTEKNNVGLNISEVAFVNWNTGGNNSISALANMKFERNYKFRYIQWDNSMELRYGLNIQEERKWRKTDDAIRLSSTFGFRRDTISNWYYSAKANFNTQFSNGYNYPNRDTPISRFMAPGYSFIGAGTSYIAESQKLNVYISPITQKATFVLDQELADKGRFGVDRAVKDSEGNIIKKGENVFLEFGFLVTNSWEGRIYKNMKLKHQISLYTDYLRNFGNIDVDWELNIELRVNKYIATNIGTQVIYDDDIVFDEVLDENDNVIEPGVTKIQFRQVLGVGLSYMF